MREITRTDMKQFRWLHSLTQMQMAELMGLSKSGYVAIETGANGVRKIHQLAFQQVKQNMEHKANA